jgi:protein-S-isoprenylcysteine O-methyltransferase Ste14
MTAGVVERSAIKVLGFVGVVIPVAWLVTPALSFADYPLQWISLAAGTTCLAAGLWLFHRSHVDLDRNWTLAVGVRPGHRVVTTGVYRRIRHPMYLAVLVCSIGQALVMPNWIAGPSCLALFVLILMLRIGPEERMMIEAFGTEYRDYVKRMQRIIPKVW